MNEQRPSKTVLPAPRYNRADDILELSVEEWRAVEQRVAELEQCHREGWSYAREIEDEYRKRTGHGFGDEPKPASNQQRDLPSWESATLRVQGGTHSALDRFIHDNEPAGEEDHVFRQQLQAVIDEARAPSEPGAGRKPDKFDLAFEIMRRLEAEDMETMQSCQFGYVMRVTREGNSCGQVEFHPIATAPKDGSTILLRCPKGIVEGCWEQVDGGGHPENGPPVYWWTSPFTEFIDGPYDAPTHWALIPRDAVTKSETVGEFIQRVREEPSDETGDGR